jgi:hypothetical protein
MKNFIFSVGLAALVGLGCASSAGNEGPPDESSTNVVGPVSSGQVGTRDCNFGQDNYGDPCDPNAGGGGDPGMQIPPSLYCTEPWMPCTPNGKLCWCRCNIIDCRGA